MYCVYPYMALFYSFSDICYKFLSTMYILCVLFHLLSSIRRQTSEADLTGYLKAILASLIQ